MKLRELLDSYVDSHERGVAPNTEDFLLACVRAYGNFLGHDPTTDDLSRDKMNSWVRWLVKNRASNTARTQRGGILLLWRYAADEGLSDWPARIRRVQCRYHQVQAWTPDEVSRLLDHCLSLRGRLKHGVPKREFFASLVASGYHTGFRLGDQLSIERDWILRTGGGEGRLTVVEQKTGKQARRVIPRDAMVLIDRCLSFGPRGRRLIWPMWARREQFFFHFRQIVKDAGITPGSYKWLRKSAGTHVEARRRGDGRVFLNHSSQTVTDRHYLDIWQTDPEPIRPPSLPISQVLSEFLQNPNRPQDPPKSDTA